MQRLNGICAMRFNRRYDRSGHLFQGRFECRVLEGEEHLATVVAYIYENAARVGLRGWPWRGTATPTVPARALTPTARNYAAHVMTNKSTLNEHPVAGIDRHDGAVVIHLVGELDLYNAPEVRSALLELCTEQPERLIVDLSEVAFVDSTALGVLIEARTKLENRQTFLLAAPGLETHRALSISGLDQHLAVHETVDSALAATLQ